MGVINVTGSQIDHVEKNLRRGRNSRSPHRDRTAGSRSSVRVRTSCPYIHGPVGTVIELHRRRRCGNFPPHRGECFRRVTVWDVGACGAHRTEKDWVCGLRARVPGGGTAGHRGPRLPARWLSVERRSGTDGRPLFAVRRPSRRGSSASWATADEGFASALGGAAWRGCSTLHARPFLAGGECDVAALLIAYNVMLPLAYIIQLRRNNVTLSAACRSHPSTIPTAQNIVVTSL